MDVPKFSKNQVRRAGKSFSLPEGPSEFELEIIDYWRAAHQYPLDRMERTLEELVMRDDSSFAVCRLKRIDSIKGKLAREGHTYRLNSMYDIAGCRYIVPNVERVYEAVDQLKKHEGYLTCKDYIEKPRLSGYRGVHLIHCFDSPGYGYERLSVETQVRTNLQHMWATAVEVYDVVNQTALKFEAGEKEEERFFALISQLFAEEEGTSAISGIPRDSDTIVTELKQLDEHLRVSAKLKAYSQSVSVANEVARQMHSDYVLLMIDFEIQQITLEAFPDGEEKDAFSAYSDFERKKNQSEDAVLLKASSMDDLQKAYPNYYSDISTFLEKLETFLK